MKKLIYLVLVAISLSTLSSCAVVMAARKEGTNISKVQQCKTRNHFVSLGGKIVSSERMPDGNLQEIYQFTRERGSAARAVMHGLLDITTLGIWEAFGTPIEGCDKAEYFAVKVLYDHYENVINVSLT